MNTKKWVGLGLAVTMLSSVALVGCGDEKESGGEKSGSKEAQELNLYLTSEIPSLDPSLATDTIGFTVLGQTNEGLIRLDKDGKVTGGVAEKWDVSPDGLTYTFNIRDNAKWSDGSNVSAKDFEFGWKRTLNPETASQYAFMMTWIKGGAEYNGGKGTADDVAVKAIDDKTLEVKLVNPIPFFLEQMAFPLFFPQKQAFVEQQGDKFGADVDKALFNGPFKLTEWVHEQSAVFKKNETYWDAANVKLDTVNYQIVKDSSALENLYLAGQIDRFSLVRDQVDRYKDTAEYSTQAELTVGYLQFNEKKVKALTNSKIRRALTASIDGDAWSDIIYHNGSIGATGLVPPGTSNGDGGEFRKDNGDLINRKETAAKAKELLAEGLKEVGLDKMPTIKILMDDGDTSKKSGEFIKEQWRTALGVDVEIENVPFKLRLQRSNQGDFDIVFSFWGADYNDPMTFLDMWITDGDFNEAGYSNPKYDDLIKKAQAEPDAKKRMGYLYDAEKILMEDMPIGPIVHRAVARVSRPYIKDWTPRNFGPDYDLKYTYIEGKE
ncbi:oligopeptide transport system substrate-binding protein [Tumebacillus sp. BK434]|uniref:peptide ABC transporter substrate-binding protein n=1 Tax=Tumebacillus sp. BK434 TaxID=2512169 RepID=UPI0010DD90BF|nr:peptide ABC transporter substrate-binding protein [Tumebacillus sp. BK434]TCP52880.1 oligopeptide transport system substrate-binding protein [Tumebacillus sp. BK434]